MSFVGRVPSDSMVYVAYSETIRLAEKLEIDFWTHAVRVALA